MILYSGEENGIVKESSAEESIFKEQYARAHFIINDMLKAAVKAGQTERKDRQPSIGSTPNIVAFCGDRGEGKTSCMESVVMQLQASHGDDYVFLDIIDPAFFDNHHNVVELLLGLLFRDFIKRRETQKEELKRKVNRDLTKDEEVELRSRHKKMSATFQDARQCLREMYEVKDVPFDALDKLSNMVQGVSLHEKIEQLLEEYLIFCGGKKALIMRIDDTDLNMAGAYEMLEKIRIYLNNPFCIILMSTKLEQLQKVVADGLGHQVDKSEAFPLPAMAMRYIIKVIPIGRQIHMPKVYSLCDEPLTLCDNRGSDNRVDYPSVKDAVVRLIFNKTRFLFYNSRGSVSPIIPNNLRNFRHLVGMLYAQDDFDSRQSSHGNMDHFIHYFYQTWTEQLDESKRQFAESLVLVQDFISLNKIVINELQKYLTAEQKSLVDKQDILNSNVANYNVSLGDVFYVLDVMDRSNTDSQLLLLTFFIRSFYSIKLYESYDKHTDNIKSPVTDNKDGIGEIYRTDQLFKKTSMIHRLLNGSYFTYQPKEILPAIGAIEQARDFKVLDGKRINELVRDVEKIVSKSLKNCSNDSSVEEWKVQMLEFLALTLRKYVPTGQIESFYRKDKDLSMPMYLAPFTSSCNYYVFDVLLPFVNVIDIEAAYNRFSGIKEGSLYQYALQHDWSLLRKMMEAVKKKEIQEGIWDSVKERESIEDGSYTYQRLRLASNITIRNGEVLSAVFEGIKSRRFATYSSSNNNVVISEFYNNITNTQMHTYPKSASSAAYTIQFSSLWAIASWLKKTDKVDFDSYFVFVPLKSTQPIPSKLAKKRNDEDTVWASEHFAKLDLAEDGKYSREDVIKKLVNAGYEDEYKKVPSSYWQDKFRTSALMKPETIYAKLGALRAFFESMTLDM